MKQKIQLVLDPVDPDVIHLYSTGKKSKWHLAAMNEDLARELFGDEALSELCRRDNDVNDIFVKIEVKAITF
jgi:hypothetical protein